MTSDDERPGPVIDPDLQVESCTGMGMMYPEVWQAIRRYIMHGDGFFQSGGLSLLADTAWHLPLSEAATVLELYFAQHNYVPGAPARGGILLPALKATYAVGTTPGWELDSLPDRKRRMMSLLERCAETIEESELGQTSPFKGDVTAIRETLEAIRTDRAGFEPRYFPESMSDDLVAVADNLDRHPSYQHEYMETDQSGLGEISGASSQEGAPMDAPYVSREDVVRVINDLLRERDAQTGGQADQGISRDEVVQLVDAAVEHSRDQAGAPLISQIDVLTAKYGVERLELALDATDRRLTDRIEANTALMNARVDSLDKNIDRFLSESQLKTGVSQVGWSRWSILLAVLALVVGLGTYLLPLPSLQSLVGSADVVPTAPVVTPSPTESTPASQPGTGP